MSKCIKCGGDIMFSRSDTCPNCLVNTHNEDMEDDYDYDEDDYEMEMQEREEEENAERAATCKCGAWTFGKDGKAYHVADCYCGAE